MLSLALLPWEYGVRNLLRRPVRSVTTLAGLTTVTVLVHGVVAFIRGLEHSLAVSGQPRVSLVHALGAAENLESSSVPARTADLLAASLRGIRSRAGVRYASPELYLGTEVGGESGDMPTMGLIRGVTSSAPLVRAAFHVIEGDWPGPGQLIVGRLAATKLGRAREQMRIGERLRVEGRDWRISGVFAAEGAAFESELWCRLDDLQAATKRQDLSLVAVSVADDDATSAVEEFCKERVDLELESTKETEYYALLQKHYGPVKAIAWLIVALVVAAGVFAGLNTMYGAVLGRVREMAALQTVGFSRRAIALSIVQEAALLGAAASIAAGLLAIALFNSTSVRFTMGAFSLQMDGATMLAGSATGLLTSVLGSVPPAVKAMRIPIVEGLKAV